MGTRRDLDALLRLARAQRSSRSARIRFRDTERSIAERTVDVLALSFDPPRWVVAAWSPRLGSLRLLDVTRVVGVRGTRKRAGEGPAAFDPVEFARRRWLDGAAAPQVVTVRLRPPWAAVARTLLPSADVRAGSGGGAEARVLASRPEILGALAASLAPGAAIDSESQPCPPRRRSPTRRASSASPPGSSRRGRR